MRPTPCAPAIVSSELNQLRQRHRHAVDPGRYAALELHLHVGRRVRSAGRRLRQRVDVLRRLLPGVLQHAAFDRLAPQVRVGAVGTVDRGRHRNAVLAGVGDLLGPGHAPDAGRGDHLQIRIQGPRRHVHAHLVVALAGAAVRDHAGIFERRDLDQLLGDQPGARARSRGGTCPRRWPRPGVPAGCTPARTPHGRRPRVRAPRRPRGRARARRRAPFPGRDRWWPPRSPRRTGRRAT